MSLSGPQASSFALRGSCGLILVGNYGGMVHVYGVIYNREPRRPSHCRTFLACPRSASPLVFSGDEDEGEGMLPCSMRAYDLCHQETHHRRTPGSLPWAMTGLCWKSLQNQKKKTQSCLREALSPPSQNCVHVGPEKDGREVKEDFLEEVLPGMVGRGKASQMQR